MKKFIQLVLAVITLASLTACQTIVVRPQSQIDPEHPWVVQLDSQTVSDHSCGTIWICQPVNVTASEACDHLVFDFKISDSSNGSVLVANARSYWGKIPVGLSTVEFGYNNPIFKQTSFSSPEATCLSKAPIAPALKSMQAFPLSFCEEGLELGCSAFSKTAWEFEGMMRQEDAGSGFGTPSDGTGYEVICEDGWVSQSGGIQGACSHHGGVAN